MDAVSGWFKSVGISDGAACNDLDVDGTLKNLNSALPVPNSGEAPHDIELHKAILQSFPGALPATAFCARATDLLKEKGLTGDNTLLSTSFCAGEDWRGLERTRGREEFCYDTSHLLTKVAKIAAVRHYSTLI